MCPFRAPCGYMLPVSVSWGHFYAAFPGPDLCAPPLPMWLSLGAPFNIPYEHFHVPLQCLMDQCFPFVSCGCYFVPIHFPMWTFLCILLVLHVDLCTPSIMQAPWVQMCAEQIS